MQKSLFSLLLLLEATSIQASDESLIQLKDGPGHELVRNNCMTCHSLDYIQMNSPFLDRKGWETEVNKMITAYHAPIDPANVPAMVNYLATYYGVPSAPASGAAAPGSR